MTLETSRAGRNPRRVRLHWLVLAAGLFLAALMPDPRARVVLAFSAAFVAYLVRELQRRSAEGLSLSYPRLLLLCALAFVPLLGVVYVHAPHETVLGEAWSSLLEGNFSLWHNPQEGVSALLAQQAAEDEALGNVDGRGVAGFLYALDEGGPLRLGTALMLTALALLALSGIIAVARLLRHESLWRTKGLRAIAPPLMPLVIAAVVTLVSMAFLVERAKDGRLPWGPLWAHPNTFAFGIGVVALLVALAVLGDLPEYGRMLRLRKSALLCALLAGASLHAGLLFLPGTKAFYSHVWSTPRVGSAYPPTPEEKLADVADMLVGRKPAIGVPRERIDPQDLGRPKVPGLDMPKNPLAPYAVQKYGADLAAKLIPELHPVTEKNGVARVSLDSEGVPLWRSPIDLGRIAALVIPLDAISNREWRTKGIPQEASVGRVHGSRLWFDQNRWYRRIYDTQSPYAKSLPWEPTLWAEYSAYLHGDARGEETASVFVNIPLALDGTTYSAPVPTAAVELFDKLTWAHGRIFETGECYSLAAWALGTALEWAGDTFMCSVAESGALTTNVVRLSSLREGLESQAERILRELPRETRQWAEDYYRDLRKGSSKRPGLLFKPNTSLHRHAYAYFRIYYTDHYFARLAKNGNAEELACRAGLFLSLHPWLRAISYDRYPGDPTSEVVKAITSDQVLGDDDKQQLVAIVTQDGWKGHHEYVKWFLRSVHTPIGLYVERPANSYDAVKDHEWIVDHPYSRDFREIVVWYLNAALLERSKMPSPTGEAALEAYASWYETVTRDSRR